MKNFKKILSLLMALVLLIPSSIGLAASETVYEVPVKLMHYSRNGSESMGARAINDVAIVTEKPGSWHYEIKSRKMEFMSMSGQLNNLFIYNDVETEDRVKATSTAISEGEWINKFQFDRPGKEEEVIVAVWVDAMDAIAGGNPGDGEQKAILAIDWSQAKVLETRETPKSDKITITVNGQELSVDVDPYIENDRTMVPVRFISEALGLDVGWDQDTRTVTVKSPSESLKLVIDSDIIEKSDGSQVKIDSPATIKESRTFVPIRAIAEMTGATVDWDGETRTVIINK